VRFLATLALAHPPREGHVAAVSARGSGSQFTRKFTPQWQVSRHSCIRIYETAFDDATAAAPYEPVQVWVAVHIDLPALPEVVGLSFRKIGSEIAGTKAR